MSPRCFHFACPGGADNDGSGEPEILHAVFSPPAALVVLRREGGGNRVPPPVLARTRLRGPRADGAQSPRLSRARLALERRVDAREQRRPPPPRLQRLPPPPGPHARGLRHASRRHHHLPDPSLGVRLLRQAPGRPLVLRAPGPRPAAPIVAALERAALQRQARRRPRSREARRRE